jgi:hypothetical protein
MKTRDYIGGSNLISVEFMLLRTWNLATGSVSVRIPGLCVPHAGISGMVALTDIMEPTEFPSFCDLTEIFDPVRALFSERLAFL